MREVNLQSREGKVGRASHSGLSGSHLLLSVFVSGAMSEACWVGKIDFFLIVNGSVED